VPAVRVILVLSVEAATDLFAKAATGECAGQPASRRVRRFFAPEGRGASLTLHVAWRPHQTGPKLPMSESTTPTDTDEDSTAPSDSTTTSAAEQSPEADDRETTTDSDSTSAADSSPEREQSQDRVSSFTATIEARQFEQLLTAVGAVVEECRLHLDREGLSILAVDPANVAMIDLSLSAAAFETYEASGGVIGVSVDRLREIASMAGTTDQLHLELNSQTRKLHISVDGLEYTLALIDPASIRQEPDLPELEFGAEFTLGKGPLARGIKAADMVADEVLFSVNEAADQVVIEAGGDTDHVLFELDTDEDLIALDIMADSIDASDKEVRAEAAESEGGEPTGADSNETVDVASEETEHAETGDAAHDTSDSDDTSSISSLFNLEYLKGFRTPIPIDTAVTIELGEDLPATLTFDIAEATGRVQYMLAPRIKT